MSTWWWPQATETGSIIQLFWKLYYLFVTIIYWQTKALLRIWYFLSLLRCSRLSWNPKAHYSFDKSLALVNTPVQMNPRNLFIFN
jgi:hypothetical protein